MLDVCSRGRFSLHGGQGEEVVGERGGEEEGDLAPGIFFRVGSLNPLPPVRAPTVKNSHRLLQIAA